MSQLEFMSVFKTQENHLPKSGEYIFGQQLSVIGIAFYLRPLSKTSLLILFFTAHLKD
jgi:hypothetical protein